MTFQKGPNVMSERIEVENRSEPSLYLTGDVASPHRELWAALLERMTAATDADRALDNAICIACGTAWVVTLDERGFKGEYMRGWSPAVTSSLPHALELVGRVLPGWGWRIVSALGGGFTAEVFNAQGHAFDHNGDANISLSEWIEQGNVHRPSPALAVVGAMLQAKRAGFPMGGAAVAARSDNDGSGTHSSTGPNSSSSRSGEG